MTAPLEGYVVTAPGLEALTAGELSALGIVPTSQEPGGVGFAGSFDDLMRANLELRTATRVLVRLGRFTARALGELERKAAELPWVSCLPPGTPLDVRVTSKKSRLYHRTAVAGRMLLAAGAVAAGPVAATGDEEGESEEGGDRVQLVVVRLFRDEVTVSLDSSGALLHRRGYRQATARAPLRETLAASMLLAIGWDPAEPLLDPFCGAGTIPIEAALIARQIAPGLGRRFAFERWTGFDAVRWNAIRSVAAQRIRPRAPAAIVGRDRDAGAIRAAAANAERAGVAEHITFECASLSSLVPPGAHGVLLTNPPYGVRVGDVRTLRDLYARLGQLARTRLAGWTLGMLLPATPLVRATGLRFAALFQTVNGGLPVRLLRAEHREDGAVDATPDAS